MSESRDDKPKSFFPLYRNLIEGGALTMKPSEIRVLFALFYFADFDTGKAHPSREAIMAMTRLTKDAFADALKGLRRTGRIRYKRGSKRVGFRYQYEILCFCPENLDNKTS